MKLAKTSNYAGFKMSKPEEYIQAVDTDLITIFNAFKGRIRLGSGANGRGENIEGEFVTFTSSTSAGANGIVHAPSYTPIGFILINKGGFGDIYMASANTAIANFVTSTTATSYTVFLLK